MSLSSILDSKRKKKRICYLSHSGYFVNTTLSLIIYMIILFGNEWSLFSSRFYWLFRTFSRYEWSFTDAVIRKDFHDLVWISTSKNFRLTVEFGFVMTFLIWPSEWKNCRLFSLWRESTEQFDGLKECSIFMKASNSFFIDFNENLHGETWNCPWYEKKFGNFFTIIFRNVRGLKTYLLQTVGRAGLVNPIYCNLLLYCGNEIV